MSALLDVILPVFLVIGFGYAVARAGLFSGDAVDGVMRFAQNFAIPCLLFRSIAHLDLSAAFDPNILFSFYAGALAGFAAGIAGARVIFGRPWADAVAIGFACMFSNTVLLGLPITERAYGPDALQGNIVIISTHAPLLYSIGFVVMECVRERTQALSLASLALQIGRAILTQPLVIGILLGYGLYFSGLALPSAFWSGIDLMARAGIPAALFGLGGVLLRYKPEGDRATIAMICAIGLILHPTITWLLGTAVFHLETADLRSAVITAAMAPGVNAYLFANIYGVGKRVTASAVLFSTALSIGTTWVWLHVLP